MRLYELLSENASAGATAAGGVANAVTGLGSIEDEGWRSIYSNTKKTKKKSRKKSNEKMAVIRRPSPVSG